MFPLWAQHAKGVWLVSARSLAGSLSDEETVALITGFWLSQVRNVSLTHWHCCAVDCRSCHIICRWCMMHGHFLGRLGLSLSKPTFTVSGQWSRRHCGRKKKCLIMDGIFPLHTQNISFKIEVEVSLSCLRLLTWCSNWEDHITCRRRFNLLSRWLLAKKLSTKLALGYIFSSCRGVWFVLNAWKKVQMIDPLKKKQLKLDLMKRYRYDVKWRTALSTGCTLLKTSNRRRSSLQGEREVTWGHCVFGK